MRLIVGLGNPGKEYARTRHNVGALVLDRVAARWAATLRTAGALRSGKGRAQSRTGPLDVALAGPVAWMNESGPAIKALLEDLGLSPAELIVVHDDLDLSAGRLRVRRGGGAGGHNGITSILTSLNTPDFHRIKIGIGRPPVGEDPADYVLSPFSAEEWPQMEQTLDRAADAVVCLVEDGAEAAMNRFNVRDEKAQEGEA